MATRSELACGVEWASSATPDASREEFLEALSSLIPRPDLPTGATHGHRHRRRLPHSRGPSRSAVVNVEEIQGRQCPGRHRAASPGQFPDNLADKIAQLVRSDRRHRRHPRWDLRPHGQRPSSSSSATPSPRSSSTTSYSTSLQGELRHAASRCRRRAPFLSIDGFIRHWINHRSTPRRTKFRSRVP